MSKYVYVIYKNHWVIGKYSSLKELYKRIGDILRNTEGLICIRRYEG